MSLTKPVFSGADSEQKAVISLLIFLFFFIQVQEKKRIYSVCTPSYSHNIASGVSVSRQGEIQLTSCVLHQPGHAASRSADEETVEQPPSDVPL